MDKAIDQLGQIESNYIDRLRRIAPLLSDKEILESVAANTQNAADMGKTMKSEAASKLGIFNKPEVQAPSAQDLSQFIDSQKIRACIRLNSRLVISCKSSAPSSAV